MIPVSKPCITSVEHAAVLATVCGEQLTYGPRTREFEREFAKRLKTTHAIATTSGTTALHLLLAALNIGPSDEVIVPNLTFVATANAVKYTGATPVLVDIDSYTWGLDVRKLEAAITLSTRAIIVVHLYGSAADMDGIMAIANKYDIVVIEDAAEGLGGSYRNQPLGSIGHAAAFSFYGNKVMTTGEGGMVVTNDDELHDRCYLLRGQAVHPTRRYYHAELGFNYRITDLQSSLGLAQLTHLDDMLSRRQAIMSLYSELLPNFERPRHGNHERPNHPPIAPWLYTFLVPRHVDRDKLMVYLLDKEIETRPTFVPLNQLPMYSGQPDSDFPVSTNIGLRGISLPTFPDLSLASVYKIAETVLEGVARCCD